MRVKVFPLPGTFVELMKEDSVYVRFLRSYSTRDRGQSIQVRHGRGHPREECQWPPPLQRPALATAPAGSRGREGARPKGCGGKGSKLLASAMNAARRQEDAACLQQRRDRKQEEALQRLQSRQREEHRRRHEAVKQEQVTEPGEPKRRYDGQKSDEKTQQGDAHKRRDGNCSRRQTAPERREQMHSDEQHGSGSGSGSGGGEAGAAAASGAEPVCLFVALRVLVHSKVVDWAKAVDAHDAGRQPRSRPTCSLVRLLSSRFLEQQF